MRYFHNSRALAMLGFCGMALIAWQARAALPRWMQDAVSGGAIEAALYRAMEIPALKALYPRPPKEAQGELSALIGKAPEQAELYSLRALEEERTLDFAAAEKDWKNYAAKSGDGLGAKLELADYYHRRLQPREEVSALMEVGSAAAQPVEAYTAATEQRSWKAFERVLVEAADQAMDEDVTQRAFADWIARYPDQPSLFAREFGWLLERKKDGKRFAKAGELIAQYRRAFPHDAVFPIKAAALLEYRRGSADKALATYDAGFQPLWPAELVESYYALLKETHSQRRFLADARERLAKNPDDLNAMARLFYYWQQVGNLPSAEETIDAFRLSKESRKADWSAQELYTLAKLTEAIHAYPEAARYYFALYHAHGSLETGASAQAAGLSGAIRILLTAPDTPVELGANNLSLYRDVATLDRGPGYWNGILSLWLNSASPRQSYQEEEQRAQPYFHRAKAAELLATLDRDYPSAEERAQLHAELIHALGDYGENALAVKAGSDFLASFTAPEDESNRVRVAIAMADAYARQRATKDEFALYDRMLTELGAETAGMPLTAAAASVHGVASIGVAETAAGPDSREAAAAPAQTEKKLERSRAFEVTPGTPPGVFATAAQEYSELLERYLGRLAAEGQLPQALAVLRKELDRNPNDPLLYERLAEFLRQNNLSVEQEEVYSQAIEKFQDRGWYDKLARLYLKEKKREAYAALTKKVVGIFSGTELEAYFRNVSGGGPQYYLQLNLYAHRRFPHDTVFVTNLLGAYHAKSTYNQAAWEKLLREHWSESDELRREFFDYLSGNGKLEAELARLRTLVPDAKERKANPDATRELAEAEMWQSHFEVSAPLLSSLAESYPADEEIGTEASSVFRSLAYCDPAQTERAVAIEKHLLDFDPANLDRLARIGDIYADSGADSSSSSSRGHEDLAAAAPYWRRMPAVHPGTPDGYLEAATIFWDYFQFDDALGEIRDARVKFDHPALYGYEAGAIDEGKRDFAGAIAEYTQAAVADSANGEPAAARLLQLARRKAWAKAVDEETTRMLAAHNALPALQLRERVLAAQKRTAEIGPMLESALGKANSADEARAIGAEAQAHLLTTIYERALEREIALSSDPVEKIELRYDLARSYEGRKEMDAAARQMEQVYRENPRLLGVVRATTDFYWRNKQPAKAIQTLIAASDAAKAAQPALSRQFTVEAADKANDSGSYRQARELMAPLIQTGDDAYNAQYLGAVAQSYAKAGDDAGLKEFYLAKLTAIEAAAMTADERKQRTVLLRRGLIPALTGMKDYAGAVDQYIGILSAYPEDATTAQETALYALRYGRQAQLVDFLNAMVKASPRDSRFAILLGQVQTVLADFPAAIDAYAHAIAIRSDRSDVYEAKANLEERLQRLDDAAKEYERLYVLSYRNPDWMVKVASARARQGRKDDAVKALERAWVAGHPATASDYFRVATQLETWNILDASLRFAELGVKAEGDDLLTGEEPGEHKGDDPEGATIYTRLLTRMRQQEKALTVLDVGLAAADKSPNSPGLVVEQAEKQGLAAVTDAEWRKRRVEARQSTAATRYKQALDAMGKSASAYFTPEEKGRFAALVEARWKAAPRSGRVNRLLWIDVASAAGVRDEEARLRREVVLDPAEQRDGVAGAQLQAYTQLEESRMEYRELAATLDSYASLLGNDGPSTMFAREADAYRKAGDEAAELRALSKIDYRRQTWSEERERYLGLLLKRDPARFAAFGATRASEDLAMAAPNYAAEHGDAAIARKTLGARAAAFPPAWETAYSALLGLYFRDVSAETDGDFHRLLGDERTVAERIGSHGAAADGALKPLAGGVWFQYGMRYGVYRTLSPRTEWAQRDPEDFLAAGLERNPAAANYVELAREYAEAGEDAAAIGEYRHTLELAPDSPGVRDAIALLLWRDGQRDAAIEEWRQGLGALDRIQKKGPAPESFWTGYALIARHLGSRKLTGQLHSEMDALLRGYLKVNGNYRSEELLRAAFEASASPTEGLDWLLSLSGAAANPAEVLNEFDDSAWLPIELREPVLLREIELARIAASRESAPQPGEYDYPQQRLLGLKRKLAVYYVERKEDAKAAAVLDKLSAAERNDGEILAAELELAARGHRVEAFLAGQREAQPDAPMVGDAGRISERRRLEMLRDAAATLSSEGDKTDALAVWEFVFERLQFEHDLMVSDYMGLAAAQLEAGKVADAVPVLRRMTLLPEDPGVPWNPTRSADGMGNFDHAATLLVEKGHDTEALEFLQALVKGVPWNGAYALRLAQARLRAGTNKPEAVASLAALAGDEEQSYDLRAQAAVALKGLGADGGKFGSGELQLLAAGKMTPEEARQPYFAAARVDAAARAADAAARAALLREALAIAPAGASSARGFEENDLRLAIFRAEAAAGNHATALAAIEPLLAAPNRFSADAGDDAGATANTPERPDAGALGLSDEAAAPATGGDKTLALLLQQAPLPSAEAISNSESLALALEIAEVFEKDGIPGRALPYFKLAAYWEKDAKLQAELASRIAQLVTAERLNAKNALRRPKIQKALNQSAVVRPRLGAADRNRTEEP